MRKFETRIEVMLRKGNVELECQRITGTDIDGMGVAHGSAKLTTRDASSEPLEASYEVVGDR